MLNDWIFIGIFLLLAPIFPAASIAYPKIDCPPKTKSTEN